jgi:hypothetical protein
MKFINMKRVALTAIALLIAGTTTANADTNYYTYANDGSGRYWEWEVEAANEYEDDNDDLSVNDMHVRDEFGDQIHEEDTYDEFGFYYVNGERFYISAGVNEQLVDNSVTFEKDGTIVRLTFTANYVDYQIYSANGTPSIEGELGATSEETEFETPSGVLFSFDNDEEHPYMMWQTDGTVLYQNGEDDVTVTTDGNELWLRHYIFAHDYYDEVTTEEYLENFFAWALANPARMDLFSGATLPGNSVSAPAQPESLAPRAALVYGNPNSYSDPDGELRKLINRIKGLSGSLIGWK